MRVLIVSSLQSPTVLGGAEIYAEDLARQLRRPGHEVGALTLGVEGSDVVDVVPAWPYPLNQFESQPAWRRNVFHAVDLYNPRAARHLAAPLTTPRAPAPPPPTIRRFRPDVVHSHSVQGLGMGALTVPSRAGVPHV